MARAASQDADGSPRLAAFRILFSLAFLKHDRAKLT
jgi:hypothetical protein